MNVITTLGGFSMPLFGLGTWLMGGAMSHDPQNDDEQDIVAIQAAIDKGITHIDTAEMYAAGYAEELVGRAIQKQDRKKLFLVSKVSPNNLRYKDVISSAKKSLKRLKVDYLDLYLVHKPNLVIPLKETMQAMDFLVEEGLVRNIGVSNFTSKRMKQTQDYSKNKIRATQVHYNLIYREPEVEGILEYCQKNDILLIAWRPIQQGIISQNNSGVMKNMCDKYQKTPSQIAINWLISQPNVVTLSTMRNPKHLNENLGALGWKMDDKDVEILRREFPNQKKISDVVPLG